MASDSSAGVVPAIGKPLDLPAGLDANKMPLKPTKQLYFAGPPIPKIKVVIPHKKRMGALAHSASSAAGAFPIVPRGLSI